MTLPGKPTTLYRHYDRCGCLLYIGIAQDTRARGYQHKAESWWHKWSVRVEETPYPTRPDALAAEREAIQAEHPVFNTIHATGGVDAIIRYLIDHERWEHVIVPGVASAATRRAVVLKRGPDRIVGLSYSETPQDHEVDWRDPYLYRFIAKLAEPDENGCRRWQGYINKAGWPQFLHPQTRSANRAAWLIFRGPIPEAHDVKPGCGVSDCVNHHHLYVTPAAQRGRTTVTKRHAICERNHPGSPPRMGKRSDGQRYCRECHRVLQRRRISQRTHEV